MSRTNGKGSVCAMLEALYRGNGYKTGFFSSPHLVHLGERAQVNRRILSEAGIVRYAEQLQPIAAGLGKDDPDCHPSFFEFMAAMAFQRFASEQVDIACIETGLGGRLDATNVVDPELAIITTVSLDHTELLGERIELIAREKAGIIKAGKPVLIGRLPPKPKPSFAKSPPSGAAPSTPCAIDSQTSRVCPNQPLRILQRWNAALAVYTQQSFADRFPIQSTAGLQQIDWPGRWQRIQLEDRTLILDATHNPEGAQMLVENLSQLEAKPIIVAGTLGEERGRSLMEAVAPYAAELYLVEPNHPGPQPAAFSRTAYHPITTSRCITARSNKSSPHRKVARSASPATPLCSPAPSISSAKPSNACKPQTPKSSAAYRICSEEVGFDIPIEPPIEHAQPSVLLAFNVFVVGPSVNPNS